MTLREQFVQGIQKCLEDKFDLLECRDYLADFRKRGMSKEMMIEALEELRVEVQPENEDTILEMLDFVTGFCNANLSVFNRNEDAIIAQFKNTANRRKLWYTVFEVIAYV